MSVKARPSSPPSAPACTGVRRLSSHNSGMSEPRISFAGYRRALRFIVPYWPGLVVVLLTGLASTGLGLLQPYFSKLLIDDALTKRDGRMLLLVSGAMFAAAVLGFA